MLLAPDPARAVLDDPELDRLIRAERLRMLFSPTLQVAVVSAFSAMALGLVIGAQQQWQHMERTLGWVILCVLGSLLRWGHWRAYLRADDRASPRWLDSLSQVCLVHGAIWGLAGLLVPVDDMVTNAAVVATLVGAASVSTFTLQAHFRPNLATNLPMLLPTAVMLLTRQDALGLFAGLGLATLTGVMLFESRRAERRITELLWLRFLTDRIARERSEALQLARRHSAVKDQFLATMSHEMRTPLHGILGLSRMLQDDATTPGARERLELIQTAGNHLLGVINDVLDLSRVKAGRLLLQPGPVNLPALAQDIVSLVQAQAHGRGKTLNIRCELDPAVPTIIEADGHRLRQVLINLMGNALKFTHRGTVTLRIRARHLKSTKRLPKIHFEVQDSGIGIPKDEQRRIFEPFHQVEAPMQHSAGTGLGLSISWQICQAMGGTLTCYSRPGKGSSFYFSLPMNGQPAQTPQPASLTEAGDDHHPPQPLHDPGNLVGAHVLLVEDNPINTIVAKAALEQQGLRVTCLDNGRQAVEWLAREETDLVLMDCLMPEMDGLEATRRVRQAETLRTDLRRTPIVALTASAEPSDQQACLEAGMDEVLCKPFANEALVAMLHRHLAPRAVRLSAQAQLAS